MKNLRKVIILLLILGGVMFFKEDIAKFVVDHFQTEKRISTTLVHNAYFQEENYQFVSLTTNFYPKNKQDLLNIFYTVLDSGMTEFTFYCDDSYTECIQDVDTISNDRVLLTNIHNFVCPYNNFQNIQTTRYESNGQVTIKIQYSYTEERIQEINQKIEEILKEITTDDMSLEDKIKAVHDYIVEHTKYDSKKSDENITSYESNSAYGPLFQGYGLCSGYADAMKLFLDKLGVKSIKIASENHIWNLVYLNGQWLHLDLTWDDPVLDTGKEIIDYDYYLITTEELYSKDDKQHYFNEEIYPEALQK